MEGIKKIGLVILLFCGIQSMAQTQIGVGISPGMKIIISKQVGTGLRSYQSGYGFAAGIPVKFWVSEFTSFNTGLDFEFAAFDSFQNAQLVSSFRISGLHLPLMFNVHLSGSFYAMAGGGVSYNIAVRDLNINQGADITGVSNRIQPNIGLGVNSLMDKNFGSLEAGILGRYQPVTIWQKDYLPFQGYRQRLLSLEFVLRYYI